MDHGHRAPAPKKRRNFGLFAGVFSLGFMVGAAAVFAVGLFIASQNQPSKIAANSSLPSDLNYEEVEMVYDSLRTYYDGKLSESDLVEGLKRGLAAAVDDPYTVYLSADENEEFLADVNGKIIGIGAQLGKDDKGNIIIIAPIDGYPAADAGLRPKDIIAEVDGQDTTDWSIDEAVSHVRGDAGTKVKLAVIRGTEIIRVEIVREEITIPSVEYRVEDGVGYMQITTFAEDTGELALRAAEEFKRQNVSGVIVDVRSNPGGYLETAVQVASLWVDKGKVVVEEKRGNVTERIDRASGGLQTLKGIKTVVLINGGSASASEILAGALRDQADIKLIGEKTFGKGSVQNLDDFPDGAALKVTIAKWYTPAGRNIDKQGLSPDTEVKLTEEDYTAGRDPQLEAAKAALK